MSPQLASILLCVLTACGVPGAVASEAAANRLTGHFAYLSGSEPDDIAIYITIRSEDDGKFSLGLMAAHPDAHGAAPDGDGEGRIGHDGIFRFSYEDSFSNKGRGTFRRAKDGYLLSIAMEPTAGRSMPSFQMTSALPLQITLALASGGSSFSR